jgi:hypothetical protein
LFTYNVVGTGSDTVQFGGYSDHGYNYLDDIALTPAQVPEPGTLGLVLAGLVVVAARIYRRRT